MEPTVDRAEISTVSATKATTTKASAMNAAPVPGAGNHPGRARAVTGCRNEAGFSMLALVVAVAVINIALGVALTRWSFIMQRQNEIELVWRGERYSRALDCYMREEGVPPTSLEELVEARCIRRLYPDPMSESGEWRVLRASDLAEEREAGEGTSGRRSPLAGDTVSVSGQGLRDRLESRSRLRRRRGSGDLFPDRGSLRERVEADRRGGRVTTLDGGPEDEEAEAIVGVVSTSDEESIRSRGDGARYSDWRFMAGGSTPQLPLLPGLTPGGMSPEGEPTEELEEPGPARRTLRQGLRARMTRDSGISGSGPR